MHSFIYAYSGKIVFKVPETKKTYEIMLPILLATIMLMGLAPQTMTKQNPLRTQAINLITYTPFVHATLSLEPPTINVVPCNTFTIEIWLKDITKGYGVTYGEATIKWNPNQIKPVDGGFYLPGNKYGYDGKIDEDGGLAEGSASAISSDYFITSDTKVAFITFHCESEGVSTITIDYTLTLISITAPPGQPTPTPETIEGSDKVEVNQYTPRAPPSYSTPVGGILTSVNKLLVLAPYLALLGLTGLALAVVVVRKRKR
jgi:hypothetical protein